MRRLVALVPTMVLFSSCSLFCDELLVLEEEWISLTGPNQGTWCEVYHPYGVEDFKFLSEGEAPDLERGPKLGTIQWEFPEGMRMHDSNDNQGVISTWVGETSGEICVTTENDCGDRSNTVCRPITVVQESVDVTVHQGNNYEAVSRPNGVGAVVDETLYFGLGADETWWSWSWDTLEWEQLSNWPGGYPQGGIERSFVYDGNIHVTGAGVHAVYDPSSDTWSEAPWPGIGTIKWFHDFGGEIFAEIASDYVFRYNPTDESWEELGQVAPPGETLASFVLAGENYIVTDMGMFRGTWGQEWDLIDTSSCGLIEVYGGAQIGGDRAVLIGAGSQEQTWCLVDPVEGFSYVPRPSAACTDFYVYGPVPQSTVFGFEDRVAYFEIRDVGGDTAAGMGAVLIRD